MFAPKVANPQEKAAANSTYGRAHQRSPLAAGLASVEKTTGLQPMSGDEAALRQEADPGRTAAHKVSLGTGWNFSEVPVFSPDRPIRPQARSPLALSIPPVIQPKLAVGAIDDPLEREADAVAEQVMRMAGHAPSLSAAPPQLQTKPTAEAGPSAEAPPIVQEVLRSPGQPLDAATRAFLEPRLGHDFSRVRVHTDAVSARSANDLNAHAYTVGHHIVFGTGRFAPATAAGQRLLAHELAHVVQQDDGASRLMRQSAPASTQSALPSPLNIPSEGVDMPWVGKGANLNSSELGYLRDPVYFWQRFQSQYPQQISPQNATRIANSASPVVDDTWLQFHPEHGAYVGETLEHHHVGQGSRAVPMPEGLHDAYTVFHPQRRVVGTPSGGTRPLPPQPTHAQHQAEINRHVQQGRIRGPGITPGTPPQAPAVPPGSELAGVPSTVKPLTEGATKPPTVKPTTVEIPARSGGAAVAGGAEATAAGAVLSGAAELAIGIAISVFLHWALSKLFELQVKIDIADILKPQLAKKLEQLKSKIAALQGSKKLFVRITYEFRYIRSTDPLMGPPPLYEWGSVRLVNVHPGNEELDFEPTNGEDTEKGPPLLERVRRWFSYSVLLDDPAKRARAKQQAELAERMRRSAAMTPKQGPSGSSEPPPVQKVPPLLAPPGVAPPHKVDLLPGAPGPSGVAEPMAVVTWLRGQMAGLLQTGEKLVGGSPGPTPADIKAFGTAEEDWRVRATYAWNHFVDDGPDMARAAMDEILHADRQGGRLITIRHNLGLP